MGSHSSDYDKHVPVSEDIGYPHGHIGHLTESEEQALKDFKVLLEEKGLYKPGPPPSHDDPTLLRFLRARKFVLADAYGQFSSTEKWRKANEIDVLYDTIDIEAYEHAKRLYPRCTGRRDKRGIPIYVFQVRHLNSATVHKYEKMSSVYSAAKTDGKTPVKLLPLFALYENLTCFVQPLSSQCTDRENAETPITLSTNIVDVSHVSLMQFWNLKSHMQAASQLATAHYPETLDRIFLIGAPVFFSTVWGWVKRWFDPNTVSKIFILSPSEELTTLETYIDRKNIPKKYGGELEWDYFDEPAFYDDPEFARIMKWENGITRLPPGPMYWRPVEDGKRLELFCVGSKDKKHRAEVIASIPKAFAEGGPPAYSGNGTTVVEKTKTDISEKTPAVEQTSTEATAVTVS